MKTRTISRRHKDITRARLRLDDHTLDEKLPTNALECLERHHAPAVHDLGKFRTLPTEVLDQVLCQLDICALSHFQRVNRRAMQVVNALTEYKAIATLVPNALIGILSIGTGQWITSQTLYEKLCTSYCERCGDFGGYLYLITCSRVCFCCFTEARIYMPLPRDVACLEFGLDRQIVDTLPRMRVIPGTYAPSNRKARRGILVDYASARNAGIAFHESVNAMNEYVRRLKQERNKAHEEMLATWTKAFENGLATAAERPGSNLPGFDGHTANPLRYVAIVRLPWLDKPAQEIEWGFHCLGCERSTRLPLHYRRQFTKASFDQHLQEDGGISFDKRTLQYTHVPNERSCSVER